MICWVIGKTGAKSMRNFTNFKLSAALDDLKANIKIRKSLHA